jgi:hypothetical protein
MYQAKTSGSADFRLCLKAGPLNIFHESQEILVRQSDKAAGNFDDIETKLATLTDVAMHGINSPSEHVLDEAARGHQDQMPVAEIDQFPYRASRH